MANQQASLLTAIDVGSAKTRALVAEVTDNGLRYRGHGVADSRGSRKGVIVELDKAVAAIQKAVEAAEDAAGAPVEHAIVGIGGAHVRGVNSHGGISLGTRPREIGRDEIKQAVERARAIPLPADREILHLLPQEFILDEQPGVRDPLGMMAARLEVRVHLVTAATSATQNVITAVNKAGVVVDDTVFEPLAAADAVLRADERELGVCLADIGAGSTDLIVYYEGVVIHTGAIPVGGDHFTNDLAVGLRTPIPEAEKIKREHAQACRELLSEDTPIEIASVGDRPPRTIFARMVADITEPRAQELLMLIRDELRRAGLESQIPAGLVLTGGGAHLRGLAELAERLFNLPVRVAVPRGLGEMSDQVSQPEYATAVGLVLYGARTRRVAGARPTGFMGKLKSMFAGA